MINLVSRSVGIVFNKLNFLLAFSNLIVAVSKVVFLFLPLVVEVVGRHSLWTNTSSHLRRVHVLASAVLLSVHLFHHVTVGIISNLILVVHLELPVELVHLLHFTKLVLSPPFIVGLHLANEEVFGFLEAGCYLSQINLDFLLLLLETLNVLFDLIDTYLESIVLCILIIHSQQFLIVLLEVILPLFVQKLTLSDFDKVLLIYFFLLLASDNIAALNHFAGTLAEQFSCE